MELLNIKDYSGEDEELEVKERWHIKSDDEAEWWIEKKAIEISEVRRLEMALDNKILALMDKLEKVKKEKSQLIASRDFYLREYYESKEDKDLKRTKTQAKYRLPSVELVMKYPAPKIEKDEEKLVKWLEDKKMDDYIKVEKTAKWAELKKITTIKDGMIISEAGEIIEGIAAVERDPEFKVVE